MARWRRPPLSWLESWSTRCSGDDTPTRRSISIVFARASRRLTCWWSMIASTIWLPTVCTGLNEDIGSWKMRAISRPADGPHLRAVRRQLGQVHPSIVAGGAAGLPAEPDLALDDPARPVHDPRIERAVTLLPQPLSPTMPRVAPG